MTEGAYLDGLLVDLDSASAKACESPVGILPVHHDYVGTSPGGNHLMGHSRDNKEKEFSLYYKWQWIKMSTTQAQQACRLLVCNQEATMFVFKKRSFKGLHFQGAHRREVLR